jgi:hypothetical protein
LLQAAEHRSLLSLHVRFGLVEEQLIVFLHAERAAVNEQHDKNRGNYTPYNHQQRG